MMFSHVASDTRLHTRARTHCNAHAAAATTQVEMFRAIAQRVDWLSDFDSWFLDCILWTPLMQDLVSPNGTCMLAPAGIPPSNQLFASGASVSWITDKEGDDPRDSQECDREIDKVGGWGAPRSTMFIPWSGQPTCAAPPIR
jgi:hypothetical protein